MNINRETCPDWLYNAYRNLNTSKLDELMAYTVGLAECEKNEQIKKLNKVNNPFGFIAFRCFKSYMIDFLFFDMQLSDLDNDIKIRSILTTLVKKNTDFEAKISKAMVRSKLLMKLARKDPPKKKKPMHKIRVHRPKNPSLENIQNSI